MGWHNELVLWFRTMASHHGFAQWACIQGLVQGSMPGFKQGTIANDERRVLGGRLKGREGQRERDGGRDSGITFPFFDLAIIH